MSQTQQCFPIFKLLNSKQKERVLITVISQQMYVSVKDHSFIYKLKSLQDIHHLPEA